jgi:hypothetical protein
MPDLGLQWDLGLEWQVPNSLPTRRSQDNQQCFRMAKTPSIRLSEVPLATCHRLRISKDMPDRCILSLASSIPCEWEISRMVAMLE